MLSICAARSFVSAMRFTVTGCVRSISGTFASLNPARRLIVSKKALGAKIILSGKLSKKLTVKGDVKASKGARSAIEGAGGRVEVAEELPVVKKLPKKPQAAPSNWTMNPTAGVAP